MKTVMEAQKAFIFHCEYEKNLSTKTIKAYKLDCKQFNTFLNKRKIENSPQTAFNKSVLKQYFLSLGKLKPKTIKRKIATLKAFLNFLEYEDEITINPFRKMKVKIKEPLILPSVMSIEEVKNILSVASNRLNLQNPQSYSYTENLRHLATLELLFATGIRVSEMCFLKNEEIDLINGIVTITGKGSKQRTIQLCHPEVLEVLKKYHFATRYMRRKYFFINRLGKRLSDQSVRIMITNYSRAAGIKKKITPHTFRHSFATLLLEQNVDIKYIQNILGHSSITTTQIYTHVNNPKQREILELFHPRKLI